MPPELWRLLLWIEEAVFAKCKKRVGSKEENFRAEVGDVIATLIVILVIIREQGGRQ